MDRTFKLSARAVKAMCDGAREKGLKEGRENAIAYGSYMRACMSFNKTPLTYDMWVAERNNFNKQ